MSDQIVTLPKNTTVEVVESALREAIVRGELAPGGRVRIEEWTRRLGVSQTPIREALQKLEVQGLVEAQPHRGFQVARFDLADFVEVYQIRAVLEGFAARLALEKMPDAEYQQCLAVLESAYDEMKSARDVGERDVIRESNRHFHMTLYAAAKSSRLEQMIRNLWTTFPFDTLALVPGRIEEATREHEEMLAAMRARDAERLGQLISHHVQHAAQTLLDHAHAVGVPLWEPTIRRLMVQGVGTSGTPPEPINGSETTRLVN